MCLRRRSSPGQARGWISAHEARISARKCRVTAKTAKAQSYWLVPAPATAPDSVAVPAAGFAAATALPAAVVATLSPASAGKPPAASVHAWASAWAQAPVQPRRFFPCPARLPELLRHQLAGFPSDIPAECLA